MTFTTGTPAEADLAERIAAAHDRVASAVRDAVRHACEAGELLRGVRAALPRGAFLGWVRAHCPFSIRTAQAYMRLARLLPGAGLNAQRVAHLGVREALRLLGAPRRLPPPDHPLDDAAEEQLRAELEILRAALDSPDLALAAAVAIVERATVIHLDATERRLRAERKAGECLLALPPAMRDLAVEDPEALMRLCDERIARLTAGAAAAEVAP